MKGTVIQVGVGDWAGRGFFIKVRGERYVITAAHCVGRLPIADSGEFMEDHTYKNFLGPLNGPRNIWAACLFVDPIADIAVFCEPNEIVFSSESKAYREFAKQATPFVLSRMRVPGLFKATSDAQILSFDGEWFSCRIDCYHNLLIWIADAGQQILRGMVGSPIILPDGSVVGAVSIKDGPHAMLSGRLPVWLVREARWKTWDSEEGYPLAASVESIIAIRDAGHLLRRRQ